MGSGLLQSGIEYIIRDSTAKGTAGVLGSLTKIEKQVKGVQSTLKTGLVIGLGALGIHGVVSEISRVARSIDDTAKASDRLGVTTEAYTSLKYAASLAGVEVDQLRVGIEQMTRKVSEAAQGTGQARKEIAELGLSAADLARQDPQQMLYELADAMAAVENPADRVRIAIKLFGESGASMVNMLQTGSGALRDAQADAERLGVTFSRVDASQVEKARDAWFRMKQVIEGIEIKAVIELAPYVEGIADALVAATTAGGGFGEAVTAAMESVALSAAKALELMEKMSSLGRQTEGYGYTKEFARAIEEDTRARYELEIAKLGREPYITTSHGPYGGPATESPKYADMYEAIKKQVTQIYAPYYDSSKAGNPTNYTGQVEQAFRDIRQRITASQRLALVESQRSMYEGTTVAMPGASALESILPKDLGLFGGGDESVQGFIGPEYNEEAIKVEQAIARIVRQAEVLQQTLAGVSHAEDRLAFADQAAAAFGEGTSTYVDAVTRYGEALEAVDFQEKAAQAADARSQVQDLDAALDQERQIIGRLADSHDRAAKMVEYEKAVRAGYAGDLQTQAAMIDRYREGLDKLRNAEFVNQQMQSLGDTLADIAVNFENAADAAESFLRSLARQAISQYATTPAVTGIGQFIGAVISNAFSGGSGVNAGTSGAQGYHQLHAGGVVGVDAIPIRIASDSLLHGAKRHHTGLMPGEVPAILQRNEGVFTQAQMAAIGRGLAVPASGGGEGLKNLSVRLINEGGSDAEVSDATMDIDMNEAMVNIWLRNYQTGGRTRSALRKR